MGFTSSSWSAISGIYSAGRYRGSKCGSRVKEFLLRVEDAVGDVAFGVEMVFGGRAAVKKMKGKTKGSSSRKAGMMEAAQHRRFNRHVSVATERREDEHLRRFCDGILRPLVDFFRDEVVGEGGDCCEWFDVAAAICAVAEYRETRISREKVEDVTWGAEKGKKVVSDR